MYVIRYMYFREVAMVSLDDRYANRGPMGGPGMTIEIDEAKIGRRKYNVGRMVEGQWILGFIKRETGDQRIEILPNNNRSAQATLPLIQRHVLPGSTIITDEWRAYTGLGNLGYTHLTVNHTYNFVNPVNQAHTQNIESSWRHLKKKFL